MGSRLGTLGFRVLGFTVQGSGFRGLGFMESRIGTTEDSNGVYSKFPEPLAEIMMSIGF